MITTYNHPYTHDNHEAITMNMTVMGEVKNGRVVYAYDADLAAPAHEKKPVKTHPKK